jgi:hypothetical protein
MKNIYVLFISMIIFSQYTYGEKINPSDPFLSFQSACTSMTNEAPTQGNPASVGEVIFCNPGDGECRERAKENTCIALESRLRSYCESNDATFELLGSANMIMEAQPPLLPRVTIKCAICFQCTTSNGESFGYTTSKKITIENSEITNTIR